jgi:hypothetical protein
MYLGVQWDEVEFPLLLLVTTTAGRVVVVDQDPCEEVNPAERGVSNCEYHVCTEGCVAVLVTGEGELHLLGNPLAAQLLGYLTTMFSAGSRNLR